MCTAIGAFNHQDLPSRSSLSLIHVTVFAGRCCQLQNQEVSSSVLPQARVLCCHSVVLPQRLSDQMLLISGALEACDTESNSLELLRMSQSQNCSGHRFT